MPPLSVAVAGASGYAGGEILRLLAAHPDYRGQGRGSEVFYDNQSKHHVLTSIFV